MYNINKTHVHYYIKFKIKITKMQQQQNKKESHVIDWRKYKYIWPIDCYDYVDENTFVFFFFDLFLLTYIAIAKDRMNLSNTVNAAHVLQYLKTKKKKQ